MLFAPGSSRTRLAVCLACRLKSAKWKCNHWAFGAVAATHCSSKSFLVTCRAAAFAFHARLAITACALHSHSANLSLPRFAYHFAFTTAERGGSSGENAVTLARNWQSGGASASAVPGLSDSIPPHMPRFVSSQNSVVQHPLVREFTQRRTRSCAADTGAHDTPTNSMICRSEFRSDAELIGVVSDRHGTADLS